MPLAPAGDLFVLLREEHQDLALSHIVNMENGSSRKLLSLPQNSTQLAWKSLVDKLWPALLITIFLKKAKTHSLADLKEIRLDTALLNERVNE